MCLGTLYFIILGVDCILVGARLGDCLAWVRCLGAYLGGLVLPLLAGVVNVLAAQAVRVTLRGQDRLSWYSEKPHFTSETTQIYRSRSRRTLRQCHS